MNVFISDKLALLRLTSIQSIQRSTKTETLKNKMKLNGRFKTVLVSSRSKDKEIKLINVKIGKKNLRLMKT